MIFPVRRRAYSECRPASVSRRLLMRRSACNQRKTAEASFSVRLSFGRNADSAVVAPIPKVDGAFVVGNTGVAFCCGIDNGLGPAHDIRVQIFIASTLV